MSTKYTLKPLLTPAQAFIINLFLMDYPRNRTFEQLLDEVRTGSDNIKLWSSFRNTDLNGEWCDEAAEELVCHMRIAYADLKREFQALPVEPAPPLFSSASLAPKPASPQKMAQLAAFISTKR